MASPTLQDLIDPDAVARLIESGYIAARRHEEYPLWVLSYTSLAQVSAYWTPETRTCRGLVVLGENPTDPSAEVIARPFPKFHNASEHLSANSMLPPVPLDERVDVTEKCDGSLGILHRLPDGTVGINTRGSFVSEQAKWATSYYRRHFGHIDVPENATLLFEIIHPKNRIVVDYGDRAELVLLAVIDNVTGLDLPLPEDWPGSIARRFSFENLRELLEHVATAPLDEQRSGEGFVARFETGLRVKVKYDEYLRLHRLLTGVTERTIYEAAGVDALSREGFGPGEIGRALHMGVDEVQKLQGYKHGALAAILEETPDEFYAWASKLVRQFEEKVAQNRAEVEAIFSAMPELPSLADKARWIQGIPEWRTELFNLLHGVSCDLALWRRMRPSSQEMFRLEQAEMNTSSTT